MKKLILVLVLIILAFLGYRMYAGRQATPVPENAATASVDVLSGAAAVTIKGYAFAPAPLRVKKGTTVTWTNEDSVSHTVTFDVGSVSSDLLATGGTYSYTFNDVGTFAYHCRPHPYMKGSVEVVE